MASIKLCDCETIESVDCCFNNLNLRNLVSAQSVEHINAIGKDRDCSISATHHNCANPQGIGFIENNQASICSNNALIDNSINSTNWKANLNQQEQDNQNNEFLMNNHYYGTSKIKRLVTNSIKKDGLFVMHFNVRSLQKNLDALCHYIEEIELLPDIIAVTETKLRIGEFYTNIDITGYNFIHTGTKTNAGGVGFYVSQKLSYSVNTLLSLELSGIEDLWIDLKVKNRTLTFGVVYRHPNCVTHDIDNFTEALGNSLHKLNLKKHKYVILGDFNIDLLKIESCEITRKYVNDLISYACKCLISKPTRITPQSKTLLDHIYTNDQASINCHGVGICDLSDHLPTFVGLDLKLGEKGFTKNSTPQYKRDLSHFDLDNYLIDLSIELDKIELNENDNINEHLNAFLSRFNEITDKHAPLKKMTRKEKRLVNKPWLTRGLLNSIKHKNNLFRKYLKLNNQTLFGEYKIYRNTLHRAIARSKQAYFAERFAT